MTHIQLKNDIEIAEDLLRTMLSVPEEAELHANTENLVSKDYRIIDLDKLMKKAETANEELEILQKKENINHIEEKILRSEILPKISVETEYFLKYPNMLFFPPVSDPYRMGMAGVTLTYPIGNLFRYKSKKEKNSEELQLIQLQIGEKQESLRHEIFTAYRKFKEAAEQIDVAKEAIEQAAENYRIVKIKYTN
ncbi:TolC family protein [Weeksellaceae bacterium A-14]